ncbi:amidohydrolase, partial [Pseudomonas sp. MWU12-2534b]
TDPYNDRTRTIGTLQSGISRRSDIRSYSSVPSMANICRFISFWTIFNTIVLMETNRYQDNGIQRNSENHVGHSIVKIDESGGAKADVTIIEKYDPTINNPALTEKMLPTLKWAAKNDVVNAPLVGGAEDFSFFAKEVPGLFVFLGVTPRD